MIPSNQQCQEVPISNEAYTCTRARPLVSPCLGLNSGPAMWQGVSPSYDSVFSPVKTGILGAPIPPGHCGEYTGKCKTVQHLIIVRFDAAHASRISVFPLTFVMLFLFPRVTKSNLLIEIDFLRLLTDFVGRQESKDQEEKINGGSPYKRAKT